MAEPVAGARGRNVSHRRIVTVLFVTAMVIIIARDSLAEADAFVMKAAHIYQKDQLAGVLEALGDGSYRFTYTSGFRGEPVSLTMPTNQPVWEFPHFPAPFEGLLPEGGQLDALLRIRKLDRSDLFGQLLAVGHDVVGSLRIETAK